jgi:SPX domain protein involved in polyphosphate accumulation
VTQSTDKLQAQRFELKYLINEDVAQGMRDFVRSHLVLDEYSARQPSLAYAIHSLYLDSSELSHYWDVINANKNRVKMRIRYYDDHPDSPVFFEIKRRSDAAIYKERAPVRREAVATLLAGHLPERRHLFFDNPKHFAAMQNFCRLMEEEQVSLKTHVSYQREAWMGRHDNSVRVTFDRDVCSAPHFEPIITTRMQNPVIPWGKLVVLELKFTTRFPDWFLELVRIFGVMQCGVAKYAEGVAWLGEDRMQSPFPLPENHDLVEKFLRQRRQRRQRSADGILTTENNSSWMTS